MGRFPDPNSGSPNNVVPTRPPLQHPPGPIYLNPPHAIEGDVWRIVIMPAWRREDGVERTGTCSWADVRIPRGHFRGTPLVAAPPSLVGFAPMYAPMRPSTYRGPNHIERRDEYGDDQYLPVGALEAPVLICDAWGRPPGSTGRDWSGRDLPPPSGVKEVTSAHISRSGASSLRHISPATSLGTGLLVCAS